MKRIALWLSMLLFPVAMYGQQYAAFNGSCTNGGVKAVTSGLSSTNTLQGSYPECLVTVYLTKTTNKATIYSTTTGTPLSNPFTATTSGSWLFFASSANTYDVTMSGGTPIPFSSPVTLTGLNWVGPSPIINFTDVGGVCDATWNGASGSGAVITGTDNTPILEAYIASLQAAGHGATILFPIGGCRFATHFVWPNNNTPRLPGVENTTSQVPIRLEGASPDQRNGSYFTPTYPFSGTTFLMDYAGNGATGPLAEQSTYTGGSGYAVGDTGTVGGTCSGATYLVTAVDTGTYIIQNEHNTLVRNGWVEQVYISNMGTGCTVADNTATATGGAQPGIGTGLTINIAATTNSAFAKIETYGAGEIELDHVTLLDPTTDTLPFFRSTNTTVYIHDNEFSGTGFSQDVLVLGGTSQCATSAPPLCSGINNPLGTWSGYDSNIDFNLFSSIRRAVYIQYGSASTKIFRNFIWPTCGTNIPDGASMEDNNPQYDTINGTYYGGGGSGENQYSMNRFELHNYYYAYRGIESQSNYFAGNDVEDNDTGGTINAYGVVNSQFNSAYNIFQFHVNGGTGALPIEIADASSAGKSVILSSVYNQPSQLIGVHINPGAPGLLYGTDLSDPSFFASCTNLATVSTVCNSFGYQWLSQYWNGSASATDLWQLSVQVATGTNGASRLLLSHTGSPANPEVDIPYQTRFAGNTVFDEYGSLNVGTGLSVTAPTIYTTNLYTNGMLPRAGNGLLLQGNLAAASGSASVTLTNNGAINATDVAVQMGLAPGSGGAWSYVYGDGHIATPLLKVNGGANHVYLCVGGSFAGLLSTSSAACTGGTGTATSLYIQ